MMRKQAPNSPSHSNSRHSHGPDRGERPSKRSRASNAATNQENIPAANTERRSSIYGKNVIKQDPRPINDKAFITQSVNYIITYLATQAYPSVLSPKLLMAPTTKDFTTLVQFLMLKYDQHRSNFGKLEEDVPLFFKQLGYPFPVNRSALYAVGTSQTWPALLAGVTWLIELLSYDAKVLSTSQDNFESDAMSERCFFDYILKSYIYFMKGEDDKCRAADEQLQLQCLEEQQAAEAQSRQVEQANESTRSEINSLRTGPSPLAIEQQSLEEAAADSLKFESIIAALQASNAALKNKTGEWQADLDAKTEQAMALVQANSQLALRVKQQTVNLNDYRELLAARDLKRTTLNNLAKQVQGINEEIHDVQHKTEAKLVAVQSLTKDYNDQAFDLQLIPADAKYADGVMFKATVNPTATAAAELLNIDVKNKIPTALQKVKDRIHAKASKLLDEQAKSQKEQEAIEPLELDREVDKVQAAVNEATNRFTRLGQDLDAELRQLEAQAVDLEAERARLQSHGNESAEQAVATLKQLKAELSDARSKHRGEVEAAVAELRTKQEAMMAVKAKAEEWSARVLEDARVQLQLATAAINGLDLDMP